MGSQLIEDLKILLLGTLLNLPFLPWTQACQVSAPWAYNFFASYENNSSHGYGRGSDITRVSGCTSYRKFLMIQLMADHLTRDANQTGNPSGQLIDDRCQIKNSSLTTPPLPFQQIADFYASETNFLNSCVRSIVRETADPRLNYPEKQPGCTVIRISETEASYTGNFCFFQPSATSLYEIRHEIVPECLKPEFLKAQHMEPTDIPATWRYFLAGDASGLSTQLNARGESSSRISINPGSELFPISDDLGDILPRWPSTWAVEVQVGGLEIKKTSATNLQVQLTLLADNTCTHLCKDGICSSPCNYQAPLAYEATLSEVYSNRKPTIIDSWMGASVLFPQWQGLNRSASPNALLQDSVRVGGHYRLELKFADPHDDYTLATTAIRQKLIDLTRMSDASLGSTEILPSLNILGLLPKLINVPNIPGVAHSGNSTITTQQIANALTELEAFFHTVPWPPYYDQICSKDLTHCFSPLRAEIFHFFVDFEVLEETATEFVLSPLEIQFRSAFGNSFSHVLKEPAVIQCNRW